MDDRTEEGNKISDGKSDLNEGMGNSGYKKSGLSPVVIKIVPGARESARGAFPGGHAPNCRSGAHFIFFLNY